MQIDIQDIDTLTPLFDAMPDALVLIETDGTIVMINKQTELMFGYKMNELLGKRVEVLMPEKFRSNHINHRAFYFDAPRPRPMGLSLELYGLRKNNKQFPVEISLNSITFNDKPYALAAVRDVTDRKLLEEQLRFNNETLMLKNEQIQEATRMKSEFLANMSHELRTPLNGIIGFAELMHTGAVGEVSPEHKEYLGDILKSSQHLLRLINDVLDLTKVESGKMEFFPEPINMRELIDEVCGILKTIINQRGITIEQNISPDSSQITVDPGKLKQILYNLLSNAVKFSEPKGKVIISTSSDSNDLFKLSIQDYGIGINESDQPKLFTEFQQLDPGTGKKYQGTGLGLALVKRLAVAQGGSVGVISSPGKGSTFYVLLPKHHQR